MARRRDYGDIVDQHHQEVQDRLYEDDPDPPVAYAFSVASEEAKWATRRKVREKNDGEEKVVKESK